MPRAQCTCPHCQDGLEDVQHVAFFCLLCSLHARFPDLVLEPTVHASLEREPMLVTIFVPECQRTHAAAAAALEEGAGAGPTLGAHYDP